MSIIRTELGFVNGYKVYLFTLKKAAMTVKLTNYSGAIVSIEVPDKDGDIKDVVLGYDTLKGYVEGDSSQGALVGRFANRIGGAKFTLNDIEYHLAKNNGVNTLHGGNVGYNKRVWTIDDIEDGDEPSVTFGYFSPDGEENFPANIKIQVKYTITEKCGLKLEYSAISDGDTVLNLTNHSYFNLGGFDGGSVLDTELQIFADYYTPVDDGLIPTGEIKSVKGTVFDFTESHKIGNRIKSGDIDGYDHNFILGDSREMRKAAVAYNKITGIEMTAYTDMPAMQLYTANGLNEIGKKGQPVGKQDAFCLETQFTPDSPNKPMFPSCVLKGGEEFSSTTIYEFSTK